MPVIISAMDENGVIGHNGGMPWRIPAESAFFQETTMGGVLIMGRTTFEDVGALPGRTTIVLSRSASLILPSPSTGASVTTSSDLTEALIMGRLLVEDDKVFVAGGSSVYKQALEHPMVTRALLSRVPGCYDGDAWFPVIPEDWAVTYSLPKEGFTVDILDRRDH